MILDAIVVGPIQANCYVLGCPETHAALVIDPGDDPHAIEALLERHQLEPAVYLLTHGHIDHVGAATPLRQKLGGEILIHPDDLPLYEKASEHALAYGIRLPRTAPPDRHLQDGETVSWGQFSGTVIHTPGHSPGGICFRVAGEWVQQDPFSGSATAAARGAAPGERDSSAGDPQETPPAFPDWVFCGDTLFQGSIGRTDLPGGSHATLLQGIRERLLVLPPETIMAPGHGPLTTVASEKRINPFLQGGA
ncbi:MAG: MBL fold metallo-hydrolase [Candidatus Eisenbacteria bacterium]|nr:MBL fold metallo-hydrolase [Candidatus Eisenbacteria bacterium]